MTTIQRDSEVPDALTNSTHVEARQKMLQINVRQKDFYESHFEATQVSRVAPERAANWITNAWSRVRSKLVDMRRLASLDEYIYKLHGQWLGDLRGANVLDFGCFEGNHLSLWLAEQCAEYTAVDLSEQAISVLNAKLRERELAHARAYAQDFLANSYPDNSFDVIYAYSVLHHFKDMAVLLAELQRVLKPGGVIVSFDPMMTEPLNRMARALYRPFQSDRDWEWPFTLETFRLIGRYFEVANMQGCLGMVKLGFPLQMVPGFGGLGRAITRWGAGFDNRNAKRMGLPFLLCWQVTLCLRKPHPKQES